jgi:dTDP-N-acetylfucosamine:lipid II N-acetylfucosaminyltransferase
MIKKIIHIAPYEKFIKSAHHTFEAAFPDTNVFYIIKSNKTYPYVLGFDGYKTLDDSEASMNSLLMDIETADYLVLHYLEDLKAKVVSKIQSNCKVIWIPWGADLYENKLFYNKPLYGFRTRMLRFKEELYIESRSIIRGLLLKNRHNSIQKSLSRIDIIACAIPQEFDLLIDTGLFKNDLKMINFFYYPLELIVSKDLNINKETILKANKILVGNSASPTSNHADSFHLLKKCNIVDKKIVVPLNYGGDKMYVDKIVENGLLSFRENFRPILDFMSLEEYNTLISSCGFAIMNHYRQQAIGNIITLLWAGTKVFLNENNLVFTFFKSIGCHIFSIQNDLHKDSFTLLTQLEIEQNRTILIKHFSSEATVSILKKQLMT